jgi:hypothetical protein
MMENINENTWIEKKGGNAARLLRTTLAILSFRERKLHIAK